MSSQPGPLDHFHAVILAGGRGTRFWPQSRARRPKQFLNVLGQESLLQQTLARLRPIAPPQRTWVLTNQSVRKQVLQQLPDVPPRQVIAEPVQRNTAPAIALAAHLLEQQDPDAVMGVFPSDHVIGKAATFQRVLRRGAKAAIEGNLVVLGIKPRWPETGYGYIEFPAGTSARSVSPQPVARFREKPQPEAARSYLEAGNFYWNSGMFLWQARTILRQIERFLPATRRRAVETASFALQAVYGLPAPLLPRVRQHFDRLWSPRTSGWDGRSSLPRLRLERRGKLGSCLSATSKRQARKRAPVADASSLSRRELR